MQEHSHRRLWFMTQSVHMAILILNILVCPLYCFGGADVAALSSAALSSSRLSASCSCCHSARPTGSQESPDPALPADSQDVCFCGSCLCHGAVVGETSENVDVLADAHLIVLDTEEVDSSTSSTSPRRGNRFQPVALSTGRNTRIAHQSFLL